MDPTDIRNMISAAELAHWTVLAGLILMTLVYLFRRITGDRFDPAVLPLVNAALGVVVAVAEIMVSDIPWWQALMSGLLSGAAAGGFWGMIGRKILPGVPPSDGSGIA